MIKKIFFTALCSILFSLNGNAQFVNDSSFNQDGFFRSVDKTTNLGQANLLLIQSDKSILVGGFIDTIPAVWKIKANGQPDMSFGINGIAKCAQAINISLIDMKTNTNGDIIILGQEFIPSVTNDPDSGQYSIVLFKFTSNGILDVSFNGTGLLVDKPVPALEFQPYKLIVDNRSSAYNEIFVLSTAVETHDVVCNNWSCVITKYDQFANRVTSFANNGIFLKDAFFIRPNPSGSHIYAYDISLRPNGTLLLIGVLNASDSVHFTMSLNQNGTLNTSYGNGGKSLIDISNSINRPNNVEILKNGQIILWSDTLTSNGWKSAMMKINENGTLNTSFGNNGLSILPNLNAGVNILENTIRFHGTPGNNNYQNYSGFKLNTNGQIEVNYTFNTDTTGAFVPYYNPVTIGSDAITYTKDDEIFIFSNFYQSDTNQNFASYFLLNKMKWRGQAPVAITKLETQIQLALFPNPVHRGQNLFIKVNKNIENIDFVSLSGQIVYSQKINNQKNPTISIPDGLVTGIYIVKIKSHEGVMTERILLK